LAEARERHPKKGWPRVNWFDLWAQVVRKEPVVVRGALSFGLKSFARALHSHGLIETSWGDTKVDGLGAMTGAWWCDEEASNRGVPLMDTDLMQEIARYNEVDCKVMMEIVRYLRQSH
jgi:predicted RecB family nuclease